MQGAFTLHLLAPILKCPSVKSGAMSLGESTFGRRFEGYFSPFSSL